MPNDFDVVIVGAGIAGAALACALAGVVPRVAVVDKAELLAKPTVSSDLGDLDARTLALTEATKTLLERLGAWSLTETFGVSPYPDMQVWDADGTAEVSFNAAEIGAPALGYIVEARSLTYSLQARMQQSGVTIITGSSVSAIDVDETAATISLSSGKQLSADLLVGADGANSQIKQLAGISSHTLDNRQRAIVCNIQTELPHSATAKQRFLPTGPLAILPLSAIGATTSAIVWSCENSLADELLELSDTEFCARLAQASEACLGDVVAASTRFAFPLVARHATTYTAPLLALVGDAAHVVHPLAGQGINLGLADVQVLAIELTKAYKRGIGLAAPKVLAAYQRQRRGDNLRMIAVTQGFKHLFSYDDLGLRWLRNQGMRMVNGQPLIKQAIIRQAMGLDPTNSV